MVNRDFWLTPAGCEAAGGHKVHCHFCAERCTVCGAELEVTNA